MPFENTPLKYLFTVIYADGTTFEQTPEDVSSIDPTKSAYYDVMAVDKPIKAFLLKSTDGSTQAAVSLEDGHFEIDGKIFLIGDMPTVGTAVELVYLRRNFRNFNVGLTEQLSHEIHYYFGYRFLEDGRPVDRVVGLL